MAVNIVGHRSRYVSHIQKKLILKFLESNPKLLSPKFSINFKFRDAQMKWTEMANMLNRVPGSKKDWRQWRKTWHDMRSKTKLKLLQGNSVFSKIENEILSIIGELPPKVNNITYEEIDIKKETWHDMRSKTKLKLLQGNSVFSKIENEILSIIGELPPKVNNITYEEIDIKKEVSEELGEDDSNTEINLNQFLTANKDPLDTVTENNIQNAIAEVLPTEPNTEQMCENTSLNLKEEIDEVENAFHSGVDRKSLKHRRSYYDRKLMVLNRIARAKERSVAAKERIAAALEKIADSRVNIF